MISERRENFLLTGKKLMFYLLKKKGEKQYLENDRPISLLSVCSKII